MYLPICGTIKHYDTWLTFQKDCHEIVTSLTSLVVTRLITKNYLKSKLKNSNIIIIIIIIIILIIVIIKSLILRHISSGLRGALQFKGTNITKYN